MSRGQGKVLMLLDGLGGLTDRRIATKISVVECLLWGFGCDDKGRSPIEHYQEVILFLV